MCIQPLPEKQQFRGPKIERKTPQIVKKKSEKKLVADVLKNPKTSLERFRVAHSAFSCYDTISRGTVRRNLKKYGVFSRKASKKVSLKKKSKCFRSKWCINMLKKPFSFWQNVGFTDETRVKNKSFSKKWNEILKKTQKI